MLYEAEAVAELQAQLAELRPLPPTHVSGKALVAQLADTIAELQARGIPLKRVAQTLRELGQVQLKDSTVAVYLRALRPKRRAKSRGNPRAVGGVGGKGSLDSRSVERTSSPRAAGVAPEDQSPGGSAAAPAAAAAPEPAPVAPPHVSEAAVQPHRADQLVCEPPPSSSQGTVSPPPTDPPAAETAAPAAPAAPRPMAPSPPVAPPASPVNRGGFDLKPDRRSRRDQPS
jgi:hypothetical protein